MRPPACAASGDSAATIPPREITIDRPCPRSCAKIPGVAIISNVTVDPQTRAFRIFSQLLQSLGFSRRAHSIADAPRPQARAHRTPRPLAARQFEIHAILTESK